MSSFQTGPEGTFIVAWSQTEVDGLVGAPISAIERGATWLWRGEAVRIDGVPGIPSNSAPQSDTLRRRAAAGTRNLIGRAMAEAGAKSDAHDLDRTFRLTDGRNRWVATLIEMAGLPRPLLMFTGGLPPEGFALYVLDGMDEPDFEVAQPSTREGAVVCFTPFTMLDTPEGPRPVEDLVAGDRVQTKDNGVQDIMWVGTREITGARLYAMPDLRPVRIREGALGSDRPTGDLIVSPDHRVLVTGAAPQTLWGESEVLVAARDLVDNWSVARDMAARSVTYIHLLLAEHSILFANGVETESFHPGLATLDKVAEDQRLRLFDVMPDLQTDPTAYGPLSRRVLSPAEAALLGAVA